MFRIESYITPIIWSYFSKYVKNFNSHDFQVSLWNGGAVFSNLELNLDVLDSELQIPLTFASGHIQELKITVPWRKITSEPIVLNVKSMELVLKYRDMESQPKPKKSAEEIMPPRDVSNRDDENSGYMRGLISKIVTNVRVNFENVVIKYVESDIAFSVNVGEASLTAADENWNDTFLDRISYSPEFILRKKLSFSDVNICLDRCNNAGLVDKFQDPMLYRCDFDVRIIQKFATTFSRTPYFYRMDLFLGHLQFCVTDEQIPMLVRLYNLFTWLMQSGSMDSSQDELEESNASLNDTGNETTESDSVEQPHGLSLEEKKDPEEENSSWTGWATSWLYSIPVAMFGDEEELGLEAGPDEKEESSEVNVKPPTPPPLPPTPIPFNKSSDGLQMPTPTTHFGVYIKTLTIIFKAVQRSCDKPPFTRRKIINIYPFLKCSIQGICCDFIMRGNENSHSLGVSSIMVHGLGFCPCGVHDCNSSTGGIPSQGGECYFEAGKIMPEFAVSSLFQPEGTAPPEWCYDVNHKDFLTYQAETDLLDKTPAFFLKYIVTRSDVDKNLENMQNPEISEILYHCVAAPCKVLLCSGLLHRLKMIHIGISNYGYRPYGFEHLTANVARYGTCSPEVKHPIATYRLVIRQPLIEILAADHPSDYSPEKRAEYFRRSGGLVVPPTTLPRLSPEWPRMIISCDVLECTAVDQDNHFFRLRNRLIEEPGENSVNNNDKGSRHRIKSQPQGDELFKWMIQKTEKKASLRFTIMEVLISFVSEPVELNIGVKSGAIDLNFENFHIYSITEILHRSTAYVYMESVTCSSRLQQRSNVLWLPFTVKLDALFEWEPTLISPSLAAKINTSSMTLFVGPETIIAFAQLTEKLSIYLHEFLPCTPVTVPVEVPNRSPPTRLTFCDSFEKDTVQKIVVAKDVVSIPHCKLGVGLCLASQSVVWRYIQKRMLRALALNALPFRFQDGPDGPFAKFYVEYCDDFTKRFHEYSSFIIKPSPQGKGKFTRFANEIEKGAVSATIWRLRIDLSYGQKPFGKDVLEEIAKSLVIESMHFAEFSVMMELCEVNLNLVNNTYYAGKVVENSALQSYQNTEGVSPDDHIMATLNFKQNTVFYSAVDKVARFNVDFIADLKVLNYESLVLEEIAEPAFVGMSVLMPECTGNCSLDLVTDSVNLKIGASMVHSVMYSTALWNQVINSFDPLLAKMVSTETQTKIILNRVLMCNDLDTEIRLRCSHPESLGEDRIPSKDCKAISFLPHPGEAFSDSQRYAQLHLSSLQIPGKEIELDINQTGYSVSKLDAKKVVFVHVSNLTSSQKLVKVSGSLILANGLDHPLEVSLFPYSSLVAKTSTVSSRSIGHTYLYALDEIEHFRFRFVSSPNGVQHPWGEIVCTGDLIKAKGTGHVSSVLVTLFQQNETSIVKSQVWLTLVTENIKDEIRNLLVLSPIYCLRSWLCGNTLVHLTSENTTDLYSLKGKGDEMQIKYCGEGIITRHMKFQSNLNVPPSAASVPLLPAGPMVEKTKQIKPIDDLLVQITRVGENPNLIQDNLSASDSTLNLKWPFIAEDISRNDWNTEINPDSEILVSFSPWVEGLPTAVADIRPWALFINLAGVELLFAQETFGEDEDESDWDQYWVPYKCVFSPKPIKISSGKFRLGIMMNDFLVKSPALQFSDQPERLSVKKINKDGKVPIDCFSRLDLFGGSQVACLTIETRVRNKILIVTVRPTYSIQNRAPFEVYAEGVTISSAVPQRRESWTDARLSMYSTLEPFKVTTATEEDSSCTAMPILHFTTDGHDYSASTPSYKYLAISCGGPWWFVQLVDCSESAQIGEGIPGTKTAVTLPKVDCSILNPLCRQNMRSFRMATEAIVVGSYTQNGQVWVSISQDNAPQLIFHNKSTLPLFYSEKDKNRDAPRHHTSCFEQYLMIPPKSSCHFSFANAYSIFPQLNKKEFPMPELMMAEVSQDLVDFVTSHQSQSFSLMERPRQYKQLGTSFSVKSSPVRIPCGNMLFPAFDIEWQRIMNVQANPTQYAKFGKQSIKITVEVVGYTNHVFLENTKMKEVTAMAVRSRFSVPKPPIPVFNSKENIPAATVSQTGHTAGMRIPTSFEETAPRDVTITIGDVEDDDQELLPIAVDQTIRLAKQWRIKAFIPELYISVQDDFDRSKEVDREFFGVTFEPIILEQLPVTEDSKLRPAECPRRESWIYACRIGNVQIDTPYIASQRPAEFPVLLEPVRKSDKKVHLIPKSAFDIPAFFDGFVIPKVLNFDSTITMTRVCSTEINLETAWLKVLPFSLYVEDRLLSYVLPSLQNIIQVFNEGYVVMEKCATIGAANRRKNNDKAKALIDPVIMKHISIVEPDPSVEYPSLINYEQELSNLSGVPGHKRSFGAGSGNGNADYQSLLFSRSISFLPTQGSSSSGLNSSSSSVVSSSMSNLRLASVSPPPPSPMIPLEPHGSSTKANISRSFMAERDPSESCHAQENLDENSIDPLAVSRVPVPKELVKLFEQLSHPVRLKVVNIQGAEVELTLRTDKLVYVALDRSVVQLKPFKAYNSVTTDFHLGLELTMHYTVGTIFTIGNPVRVLGSLELLGSPGTLARTVGTGLRDLVVYPYEGILNGPVGFVSGLGYGMTSLLRSVTSGTLVSLTNWAESVSRNIDRLTLDQQEQLISEAERQVELQGFRDGFVHGLSGFGIRILGAIGGLSHYPINNVIHRGPTTTSVLTGVSRGVIGAVVKPIGGVAELISMTGQGVLLATGWKPKPKVKKPKMRNKHCVRKSSSESS